VILPVEVVADIDKLVGRRGRSAFLTEVARDEILRRKQRIALRKTAGAWKDKDHPELTLGSAAWVNRMRAESEERLRRIERRRNGD
jgi:hypothetical protein